MDRFVLVHGYVLVILLWSPLEVLYCNVNSPLPKTGRDTDSTLFSDEIYVTGTQVDASGVADLEYIKPTLECGYTVDIHRDQLSFGPYISHFGMYVTPSRSLAINQLYVWIDFVHAFESCRLIHCEKKRFVKALQQNSVFWPCTKIRTAWNEVRLICEKIISNEIPLDSNSLVKYYMLDMTNNIKSSTKKLQTYIQKGKQKLFAKVWGLLKYVEDRESIIWQFSSFSWEFWMNEDFPFFPKKMHILLFSHALGVICCYVFVHVFDLKIEWLYCSLKALALSLQRRKGGGYPNLTDKYYH